MSILDAYSWRDWMPIVQHPGPDGGSPLYAKIQISLSNPSGEAVKLSFVTDVYDQDNQPYRVTFQVLPDQYSFIWDGPLKAGENRVVELLTNDGPYLPVGSKVFAVVVLTDQDGNTQSVKTLPIVIDRSE